MTIYKPELVSGDKIPMAVTNPRHLVPATGQYQASGTALAELGNKVGADAVLKSGTFEDAMLTDPDSVDPHDVTIAMAKANLSLNITRTVMDRIVKGWKEIINTR
jgi:flagellar hook-basal body complex protein FliE